MTTATTSSPETQAAAPRKPRAPRPPPVSVTQAAVERVRALLAKRGKPSFGVRVGVRTRGCSGLSYTLEYADAAEPGDEVIRPTDDVTILIAPKAAMFLFGTEMDFVEENLKSGFTFRNPNEKGRCGCGESFHI
jgi:iron-sulfur cluster assembly protein